MSDTPRIIDVEPTKSPSPHKRVIIDGLDPTEYSRDEYDRKLRERNINTAPWPQRRLHGWDK